MTLGSQDHEKLLKKLRRYPQAVYIAIGVIGGAMVVFPYLMERNVAGSHFTINSIISDLGTGILGAVLIFFFLDFFYLGENTARNKADVDLNELKSELNEHITQVTSKISLVYPDKIYQASQEAGKEFNFDITQEFQKSKTYTFRGASAKYVPVRIAGLTRLSLTSAKIIMLNPVNEDGVERRAMDRQKQSGNLDKSVEQLKIELKEEIFMTIIGFYECRKICPVQIIFDDSITSVYRLEIVDDHTYLSFYQSDESFKNTYPETIRYRKESIFYQTFYKDCHRLTEVAKINTININHSTTERQLCDYLQLVGCPNDQRSLTKYRNLYRKFFDNNHPKINKPDN